MRVASWIRGCFLLLLIHQVMSAESVSACGGGKADITFLIDYSRSVGQYDFDNYMLPAVAAIIDGVGVISADSIRVAAVGFSTRTYLEFTFNEFLEKSSLLEAVKSIMYKDGNTATGEALYLARSELVPQVRPGVKHIVIILTDGVMNEGRDMEPEAKELRKTGSQTIAVGVGPYMDQEELLKLGGSPDHVLVIKDFNELLLRVKEIIKMTCKTIGPAEPKQKPPNNVSVPEKCTGGRTEVTFVVDASGSVGAEEFNKHVKAAIQGIIGSLSVGPTSDRVAMVLYSSAASLIFNLDTFSDVEKIYNAVQNILYTGGGTATGEALALVQHQILPKARIGVPHIVIVITDGMSNIGRPPSLAAAELKQTGVLIFAVGVGSAILKRDLVEIASRPENILSVKDYADLKKKSANIAQSTCQLVLSEVFSLPPICKNRQEAFLTFVVDNSVDQGSDHFRNRVLTVMNAIVSTLSSLENDISFALITYSDVANVEFEFKTYGKDSANIMKHIEAVQLSKSHERALSIALNVVQSELNSKVKPGATHVVVLFTAGEPGSQDCYADVAANLKDTGAQIVVVPSHHLLDKKTLIDLTSFSSTVNEKLKSILKFDEVVEKGPRASAVSSVICSLIPAQ